MPLINVNTNGKRLSDRLIVGLLLAGVLVDGCDSVIAMYAQRQLVSVQTCQQLCGGAVASYGPGSCVCRAPAAVTVDSQGAVTVGGAQ